MLYVISGLLIIIILMMLGMWQGLATMNTNICKGIKALRSDIQALKTNKEDL